MKFFSRGQSMEVTIAPSGNVMENRTPAIANDRSSTRSDAGHLYGFMLLSPNAANPFLLELYQDSRATQAAPTEYFFTVPPRSIDVTEPATVSIQPTIGRNYLVEHQGSLLKQLSIQGTTGFRPMATSAKASSNITAKGLSTVFGRTVGAVTDLISAVNQFTALADPRGIPSNEKTGYFNFMQLRNLFRRYMFLRSNTERSIRNVNRPTLVWVNFHEYEFWVCEPNTFSTSRAANSPLTFSYNITATLLHKLDALDINNRDWVRRLINYGDVLGMTTGVVSSISNLAFKIAALPEAVVGDVTGLTRRFATSFTQLAAATEAMIRANDNWNVIGDRIAADVASQAETLGDEWDAALSANTSSRSRYAHIERGNSFREAIRLINRMRTLRRDQQSMRSGAGVENDGLRELQRAYGPATLEAARVNMSFPKGRLLPNFGEDSDVRNMHEMGGRAERTIIGVGEDARMISRRMYGTEAMWKRIVLFNGLRYPYIASTRGEGILQSGDEILIPGLGESVSVRDNLVLPTLAQDFTNDISALQPETVVFGRDLRVNFNADQTTGQVMLDFATTPGGDMAKIEGRENLVQALTLLANTPRGSLKLHETYGFPVLVGERISYANAAIWLLQARQALNAEPRLATISDVAVGILGDVFAAKVDVVAQQSLERIPITTMQRI